jgi:hypothetical protein
MSKQKWKTAGETMAELEKDPAFVERRRKNEEEHQRRVEAYAVAEAPLVEELRKVGVSVTSVWDLVNSVDTPPQALPVLLKHLQDRYPDAIREGIARALAVPAAKFAWPVLVKLYEQEQGRQTKDGLAVALANIADDETIDELISVIRDRRHGGSRVLLLSALGRSPLPRAQEALAQLADDPELYKEVQAILRRRGRPKRRR